ncbi:MAG: hypothetical protein JXA57_06545, partial [Armatimonadetes bacterium]|nr:hypothetical protein [Armatimonadota bacterium]
VAVPAWLISDQIVAADSARHAGSVWDPNFTIASGGSAVVEFRVPVSERGGEARGLTLNVAGSTGRGAGQVSLGGGRGSRGVGVISPGGAGLGAGSQPLSVSAFDFRRKEWTPLPSKFPSIAFPNAPAAMSADGRVLIRLEASGADVVLMETKLTAEVRSF